MREHWREKDWVWRASEGSLRQAVVAAADRIEALEAALRRTEDHMRGFAEISPLDRTAETDAIIFCNAKLLQGT